MIFFISIILLLDGFKFLEDLPSSRFNSSTNKIYFNMALIIVWIIVNHSLIFFLKNKWLLNSRRSKFSIFLLLSISFGLAATQISETRRYIDMFYYYFGIGHLHPVFIDLRGVLAGINKVNYVGEAFAVECEALDAPCIGWGWSYGSTILQLRALGVFREDFTHIFAIIIFLFFLKVIMKLSKDLTTRNIYVLLLTSGVSLLIIERMNIDILVLLLLFWVSFAKGSYSKIFSFLAILLFSLTKFYTFFLIPIIIIFEKSVKIRIFYLFLSFLSVPIAFNDIKTAGSGSLNFGYAATFGLKNLIGSISNRSFPSFGDEFLPIFIILLCFISLTIVFSKFYYSEFKYLTFSEDTVYFKLFVLSSINVIFAWFLASNYPYRLVAIFGTIPFLVKILKNNYVLLVFNISLCFISFNSLPISLTITRNLFFGIFMASLIAINLTIFYIKFPEILTKSKDAIYQFLPHKRH